AKLTRHPNPAKTCFETKSKPAVVEGWCGETPVASLLRFPRALLMTWRKAIIDSSPGGNHVY
ncbi:MAG TPA: hypothetical protein VJK02_01565, partial [Anaerolineales bacterium]|nr:hypothetical protein [Anaerolineales bacterium]